ncbi:MAG: hypothetical protein AAGK17_14400 [Pseudomonadota bacterium]
MQIHPAISALRDDPDAQAKMQSHFLDTISDWHGSQDTQRVLHDLNAFSDGAPLEDCSSLYDLLSDHRAARKFVDLWQRTMVTALREYPLAKPGFGHASSDGLSQITLMACENAALAILAHEQRDKSPLPSSVVFEDQETHECVVTGSAHGLLHEVRQCGGMDTIIDTCSTYWQEGNIIVTKGPCETRQVVEVAGTMVLLQLSRRPANPQSRREYSINTGELIHSASGHEASGQKVTALAVLGAMAEHGEAHRSIAAIEKCAKDWHEETEVRWEAVRQLFALNTDRGLALLDALAEQADDPLSIPAQNLRSALPADLPEFSEDRELPDHFGSAA